MMKIMFNMMTLSGIVEMKNMMSVTIGQVNDDVDYDDEDDDFTQECGR